VCALFYFQANKTSVHYPPCSRPDVLLHKYTTLTLWDRPLTGAVSLLFPTGRTRPSYDKILQPIDCSTSINPCVQKHKEQGLIRIRWSSYQQQPSPIGDRCLHVHEAQDGRDVQQAAEEEHTKFGFFKVSIGKRLIHYLMILLLFLGILSSIEPRYILTWLQFIKFIFLMHGCARSFNISLMTLHN
jgi:hypothetical protein